MPVFLLPNNRKRAGGAEPGRYYTAEAGARKRRDWIELSPEESLAVAVLTLAEREGSTITTAESCTGGALGAALTEVAGSSSVFLGGVVSYSYEMKELLLGVSRETLDTRGAVSAQCAQEMCAGAARRLGGTVQIAITGIAGPGGGTPEKPVGLVYMAVGMGDQIDRFEFRFAGDRREVRERSVEAALLLLHSRLRGAEGFPLDVIDGKRLTAG